MSGDGLRLPPDLDYLGAMEAYQGWRGMDGVDDVSDAEIEGEPDVGLKAKVEGTEVNDYIKAREVEIKEPGTLQKETEEQESVEVSCDEFMKEPHISKEVKVAVKLKTLALRPGLSSKHPLEK